MYPTQLRIRFDPKKGTPEATLPVPEASDVERSANINFDEVRTECQKLRADLDNIDKAKEKVILESDEVNRNFNLTILVQ